MDQFGTTYTPRIQKQNGKYKSQLGGLASLIVYCTSLCYCIYKFYIWQTNQLPPFMTNYQQAEVLLDEGLNDQAVQFSVTSSSGLNPFDVKNMILLPIIQTYVGANITATNIITEFYDFAESGWGGYLINLTLTKNASLGGTANTSLFILTPCSNMLLQYLQVTHITCASSQNQSTFFASYNVFHMDNQIQQFNPQQGQLSSSRNGFYFLLDPSAPVYTQVLFQQTKAYHDTGIVFQDIRTYPFISSFSLITQSLNPSFAAQAYGLQVVAGALLRLDSISNKLTITNPKLGNVLADISSIFEVLLLLRIFVLLVNKKYMLDEFYDQIIAFYYPEYKQVKITYTFLGTVKDITFNDKSVRDVKKMHHYIESLKEEAKTKLTAMNTIYELSRVQFIVSSMQSREALLQSHQVGIKLKYCEDKHDPGDDFQSHRMSNDSIRMDDKLCDDDFNLLGMESKNKVNNEMPFKGPNFYLYNQVLVP